MASTNKHLLMVLILAFCYGCAAPLQVDDVTFIPPSEYPNSMNISGLQIAIVPIESEVKSNEVFGTDLRKANLLAFQCVVQNKSKKEFEINSSQVYAITPEGRYTTSYNLNKAAQKVRESSIGRTAVTQTVAGSVAGAALGAAIGAGIGHASGDASTGAESGAVIGGATGAAAGLNEGLSDSWTVEFKKQLASHAFEDRVIYPGDIQEGFIYFKWKNYNRIRIKIFDITDNEVNEIEMPVKVTRY